MYMYFTNTSVIFQYMKRTNTILYIIQGYSDIFHLIFSIHVIVQCHVLAVNEAYT